MKKLLVVMCLALAASIASAQTVVVGAGGTVNVTTAGQGYFFGGYVWSPSGASGGTFTQTANEVRVMQFVLPFRAKVSSVRVTIGTLSVGGKYGVGIYNASKNLVASAVIATDSAVSVTQAITPVTLEPGIYWFAWTMDNAVAATNVMTGQGTYINVMNTTTARYGTAANASAAGVLPATLGVVTANNGFGPAVALFEP